MTGSTHSPHFASIILCITTMIVHGCAGSESSGGKASLGEEFTLREGESARVGDNLRLTFQSVEEDSRCPEGVQCAWEGNARVRIGYITPDHPPIDFALNTSGRYTRDTTIQGYHITLRAVLPTPKANVKIDPKEYSVRMVVEK